MSITRPQPVNLTPGTSLTVERGPKVVPHE